MSSGFVSAGTNEKPVERDAEWVRVQQELEEERRRKADAGKQGDGKSLYEVLQQNKLAKQEQFEEKTRLKNQFRALDDDEVEFLDSVLESTRAQEAALKRETADQLEEFRKQREEAEKAQLGPTSSDVTPAEEEEWTIPARKKRRGRKDLLLSGKKRKISLGREGQEPDQSNPRPREANEGNEPTVENREVNQAAPQSTTKATEAPAKPDNTVTQPPHLPGAVKSPDSQASKVATGGGLVAYGSDSDSE